MQRTVRIAVIGAGFSGISAATYLASKGYAVEIFEQQAEPGGRARQFCTEQGYTFDMGPSWYWMPDVFERWFRDFGQNVGDWYRLKLLDPAFEVIFGKGERMRVPDSLSELCDLFEQREKGAGLRLRSFMEAARWKYETAISIVLPKPGLSPLELLDGRLIRKAGRFNLFSSLRQEVRRYFRHPQLIALMEFPVLFLGTTAGTSPALYSLMNHAGFGMGTWYPEGGFGSVVRAMTEVASQQGVRFRYCGKVTQILAEKNLVRGVVVDGVEMGYDGLVASGDYHHIEQQLLPGKYRNYGEDYWDKRTFAPSCLVFYLGIRKKLPGLLHHTLFFDEDMTVHAAEIYRWKIWPAKPLFYVCRASASDDHVAPRGCENLFLLMPITAGLEDRDELREHYYEIMLQRLERHMGESIGPFVEYKRSYCVDDFITDYGAYKGNAYGLANTLLQTHFLKPKMVNRKLRNMVYTGQLTVPGPGVPTALISGKIAAGLLAKALEKRR